MYVYIHRRMHMFRPSRLGLSLIDIYINLTVNAIVKLSYPWSGDKPPSLPINT